MHDLLGWHTPVVQAFRRRTWKDEAFKVILGYIVKYIRGQSVLHETLS